MKESYKRQPPQMAHCHMRRSAVSAGRPGGLIREITWKAGESGNMLTRRFAFVPPCGGNRPYIGRKAKNFRPVFEFSVLCLCLSFHFVCLSFPPSQNN